MAEVARVLDTEVIKSFRATLVKFIESASAAVTDAEAEIIKKMNWLEGEQAAFWTNELRKTHELVNRCKDAVRQKKIFKDSTGKPQSAIDEEKALKKAQAKLLYVEERLANTKKHARQLQREHMMYRGGVQRFQTILSSDLPRGVQMLETVLVKLDAYLAGGPTLVESMAAERPEGGMGMAADGEGAMSKPAEPEAQPAANAQESTAEAAAPAESAENPSTENQHEAPKEG